MHARRAEAEVVDAGCRAARPGRAAVCAAPPAHRRSRRRPRSAHARTAAPRSAGRSARRPGRAAGSWSATTTSPTFTPGARPPATPVKTMRVARRSARCSTVAVVAAATLPMRDSTTTTSLAVQVADPEVAARRRARAARPASARAARPALRAWRDDGDGHARILATRKSRRAPIRDAAASDKRLALIP